MKVSVFGLGYVGCVSAACLATEGHKVIGVDVNPVKVDLINAGKSPIVERDTDSMVAAAVKADRLSATLDSRKAVLESDISLVCVGTPSNHNGSQDLSYLERVSGDIGQSLKYKDGHSVVVRSTVPPGSTEQVVIPALEKASGKTAGQHFGVCVNPEFMREGNAVHDFYHPPFVVVGEVFPNTSAQAISALYHMLSAPFVYTSVRAAEMIKYVNNAWHALKVAFANEIGTLCKENGIDSHELMDIFCRDIVLNISTAYLKPGFAFGGSCLPKELRAINYQASRADLALPLLGSILPSNEAHIRRALELIVRSGKRRVGLLGLSFKAGTDDLRESPLVILAEWLIGKGYHLRIYDRGVSLAQLIGTNKEYIEREIPHIARLMMNSAKEVVASSEVIVVGNKSPEMHQALNDITDGQIVIDLARIEGFSITDDRYQGICW
ncbi:MAG: UDP-glucose/GDP-mannose dehydrogenase family protein [Anaerolineae bacterium]|nr:UDP-glucose/GDP-mannose dehydrogenase family protein [Anaerolineae bacterium]